jgi:hypothetical protein
MARQAMSARPEHLIAAVRAAGGTIRRDGDMLELMAPRPLPPDLIARIRKAKPALLLVLTEADDWRARHRGAIAYWSALHPAAEAARLAWGELEDRWHRLHRARMPEWQCAGCGELIGGAAALDLADGARVHVETLNCVLRYGERWRRAATEALSAIGLEPPATDHAA